MVFPHYFSQMWIIIPMDFVGKWSPAENMIAAIMDTVTGAYGSLASNHHLALCARNRERTRHLGHLSTLYNACLSPLPAKLAHNFRPSDLSPASSLPWASIINSATKYHIPSARDPFIRHSNGVFLWLRIVPAWKHVNTYGAFLTRCTQTISFDDVHQPFLILTSYLLPLPKERPVVPLRPFLAGFHVRERRYALLRRPALREAFGNISSLAWGTADGSAFFPSPT